MKKNNQIKAKAVEKIDDWVDKAPDVAPEEIKRLTVRLPVLVHRAAKLKAMSENKSLQAVVSDLLRGYVG